MRTLPVLPAILFGTLILLQSCSKESAVSSVAAEPDNVVNATISVNQTYQLSVGNLGDVNIAKQASHFQVSQTELDAKNGLPVYKYVPATDYAGVDEVILSTKRAVSSVSSGSGCSSNHSSSETVSYVTSNTIIKLKIAN